MPQRTDCQAVARCQASCDVTVVFYLLKMQNMIIIEPHNVLLLHYVSISFYALYDFDIASNCSRQ